MDLRLPPALRRECGILPGLAKIPPLKNRMVPFFGAASPQRCPAGDEVRHLALLSSPPNLAPGAKLRW